LVPEFLEGSIWFWSFWKIQFGTLIFLKFSTFRYISFNVVCIMVSCHCAIEMWVKLLIGLVCLLGVVNLILVSLLMLPWSSVLSMILRLVI